MIKNGKYFVLPPKDGCDFKELFKRLAAEGAGRPVDKHGLPSGPWTSELLVEAISQIDANRYGIEQRTVQHWFQDNERGVSADNIQWLARIFGCDDPLATSEWQKELSAANSRLATKRRVRKKVSQAEAAPGNDATGPKRGFSLAKRSEAFFSRRSPLDLPASVFAGAVALGFLAYLVNIHSVTYGSVDGPIKQVGFLWAPNWTLLFMVFLPLYLAYAVDLLAFWKDEGRSKLAAEGDRMESDDGWARSVEASSYTYWAVFLICLPVAGLFQWVGRRLIPLMKGDLGNQAIDWGVIAIERPEVISLPEAVGFTGIAYLYMACCFYLFFVGLILLYTMAHDLWIIGVGSQRHPHVDYQREAHEVGLRLMCGIYRCTVLGVLIAICMKLQSSFLISSAETIVGWLGGDFLSVLGPREVVNDGFNYSTPTHYSSLVIALATCVVFLHGSVKIHAVLERQGDGVGSRFHVLWGKMMAVVALLVACYLLIGVFAGFSILLSVGVLLALYSLIDPGFGRGRASKLGDNQDVL